MMEPIRVVIVDDHGIVRDGLRAMLRRAREVEIVGEADRVASALAVIEECRPDAVLLDVRLGRESGLDACRRITERHPQVSVVFLTVYEDEQYVFEALRAGGRGYLLKSASRDDIVRTVCAVVGGQIVIDPALSGEIALRAASLLDGRSWPGADHQLTRRESEVLDQLVRGLSNQEIGRSLYISEETVKSHVKAILRKLGARDRAQALSIVLRDGLVH
jgi:DNA-binding NarL/FixJ family response regulator